MSSETNVKNAPSLLVTILRQITQLFQDEVALAKAELSRNLGRAGVGLALIGVAALLALTALDVLAGALVGYLATTDLTVGTSALLVGCTFLALALVLGFAGRARLTSTALKPERTAANISRDIQTVRHTTDG
ncbi:phage holin family protein [Tateyamaria pelophila]|uniref:phage holin family protein n=1 Tax=Tateyamaria pelophila TaxID=328415 RepID=UPI001CBF7FFB|nr:phage holin family protein [Tateyamaria pelophila]